MISVEMARCIAKISGDGCLTNRYIRYNNNSPELIEEFVNDVKKEFNHLKFTYGITNTKTSFVQIHGKHLIMKFLEFLPSYKSGDIYVPEQVSNSSKEIKTAYIKAFFDDEGSVCIRIFDKTGEWKRNVKIDSKSRLLLEGLKKLLLELGIETNLICTCHKKEKTWHYLGISGKENFNKFSEIIGFSSKLKQKKLSLLLRTYSKTINKHPADFKNLKLELKELLKPQTRHKSRSQR